MYHVRMIYIYIVVTTKQLSENKVLNIVNVVVVVELPQAPEDDPQKR